MTVCVGTKWLDHFDLRPWIDHLSFVYIGPTSLSEEEERCHCDCVLCPWLEGRFYCCTGTDR